jgi:hypothetical protein
MRATHLLIAGLAALPLATLAADFDYTYVEGSYVTSTSDFGPANVDGDGLAARGSYAVNRRVNLIADYGTQDFGSGVDSSTFDFGAGGHWALKADLDFVGEAKWVRVHTSTPFGGGSDSGLGLAAGLRFRPKSKVELQGMINYFDVSGSDTSLGLSGRYYLSNNLAVGGGLLLNNGDTGWNIGVRAGFGGR